MLKVIHEVDAAEKWLYGIRECVLRPVFGVSFSFLNRFGDAYIESSFRVGGCGGLGLASCPADVVERIIAERRTRFFSRRLPPGMSQPTRIGIPIGVCFEGIESVVDGLFDMQPFPLRSPSIHTARGARFLVHPTPITRPLQLPRPVPYLYSPTIPATPSAYSLAYSPEPVSQPRVTRCISAQCCVELECGLRWYVHLRLRSESGMDPEEPTIGAGLCWRWSEWSRGHRE